jgi:Phasin protein
MSTTQQDKPTAKQRQRNRKADRRNQKSERQTTSRPDQDETSPIVARAEIAPAEAAPVAMAAAEEATEVVLSEAALSGEVLPPDVRDSTRPSNAVGLQTIAQAYGDYTRTSWLASRFLVERLVTARSFDEAIAIQGEFARQAYANFAAQSQKVCELYGELAQQFFSLDKFAPEWTRIGR